MTWLSCEGSRRTSDQRYRRSSGQPRSTRVRRGAWGSLSILWTQTTYPVREGPRCHTVGTVGTSTMKGNINNFSYPLRRVGILFCSLSEQQRTSSSYRVRDENVGGGPKTKPCLILDCPWVTGPRSKGQPSEASVKFKVLPSEGKCYSGWQRSPELLYSVSLNIVTE